ncbi:MAG: hypothetical protein ACYTFT_06395, partial [Planctomycetota bacterium]
AEPGTDAVSLGRRVALTAHRKGGHKRNRSQTRWNEITVTVAGTEPATYLPAALERWERVERFLHAMRSKLRKELGPRARIEIVFEGPDLGLRVHLPEDHDGPFGEEAGFIALRQVGYSVSFVETRPSAGAKDLTRPSADAKDLTRYNSRDLAALRKRKSARR